MQKLESISKIISFLLEFYGQIGKIKAISYRDYVFLTDTIENGLDRKLTMTWPDSFMNTTNTHINKMVRILPLLIVVILITSCKEKTSYRMQLLIENKTDNKISVKLFPKSEYLHNDLYDFSDFGSGYNETEHNIESNRNEPLYYSENTDQKPFNLAAKIFDSIHITPFNKDKKVMKFSIDTVIGYSENLFDSISSWNYEIKDYDEPDNFNQNPVESHDYSFIISIDKY